MIPNDLKAMAAYFAPDPPRRPCTPPPLNAAEFARICEHYARYPRAVYADDVHRLIAEVRRLWGI